MKKKSIIIILLSIQLVLSCQNDNISPFPKELILKEVQTDFRMWVGGTEVNTDNVNPENMFEYELFEWIENKLETIGKITYIFENEYQLEIDYDGTYLEYEYEIRNDSIFILNSYESYHYLCEGNLTNISSYSCLFCATHRIGNGASVYEGVSNESKSVYDMLKELNLSNLEDMSENDTIVIMNYKAIYK